MDGSRISKISMISPLRSSRIRNQSKRVHSLIKYDVLPEPSNAPQQEQESPPNIMGHLPAVMLLLSCRLSIILAFPETVVTFQKPGGRLADPRLSATCAIKMLLTNAMRHGLFANVHGEAWKSYAEAAQATFTRPDHHFGWARPNELMFPAFGMERAFKLCSPCYDRTAESTRRDNLRNSRCSRSSAY